MQLSMGRCCIRHQADLHVNDKELTVCTDVWLVQVGYAVMHNPCAPDEW